MTVTRIAGGSRAVCGTRTPGDSSGTPGGRDRSAPLVRLAAGVRDSGPTPVVARSLDAHACTPDPAGPGRRPAGGAAGPPGGGDGGPRVVSRHAILVDADGGAVLWGRASRTPRPPASSCGAAGGAWPDAHGTRAEIGRASCRERV